METTYHVWNEHTLLYKKAGDIFYIVLAGNILKGGADPFRGVVCPLVSDLRSATLADFEAFRVCSKSYVL